MGAKYANVVFVAYVCNYGGIETLIIRMTKWLTQKGVNIEVIYDADRNEDTRLINELIKFGAKMNKISFRHSDSKISKLQKKYDNLEIQCIVFSYVELIIADKIFGNNLKSNLIFYDAHQYNLVADFYVSGKLKKGLIHYISKVIVNRLYRDHKIVFMDSLCKDRTIKEFQLKNLYDDDIVHLPMEMNGYIDLNVNEKIQKGNTFNILTVTRMVFPFKGYVFGLVELFNHLVLKYPNLRLTVIGTGDDEEEFSRILGNVDYKIREHIIWIKGVSYGEIKTYMEKANLYIGMGTTVIDAVNCGVPALSVGSYTYECKGYGYFYQDPANLGGIEGNVDLCPYIEAVINLSKEQYLSLSQKDYIAMKELYDIETNGRRLLDYKNSTKRKTFNLLEETAIDLIKRVGFFWC